MEALSMETRGRELRIAMRGEVVAEAVTDINQAVVSQIEHDEPSLVIVDLFAVTFMDSSGIGFLIRLQERLRQKGVRLVLERPSRAVRGVLRMVQILDRFEIRDGDAAAT